MGRPSVRANRTYGERIPASKSRFSSPSSTTSSSSFGGMTKGSGWVVINVLSGIHEPTQPHRQSILPKLEWAIGEAAGPTHLQFNRDGDDSWLRQGFSPSENLSGSQPSIGWAVEKNGARSADKTLGARGQDRGNPGRSGG